MASLRAVPCKHFAFGEGTCPFGSSCFYAHMDKTGKPMRLEPRQAYGKAGSTVLPTYRLSDFLSALEGDAEPGSAAAGQALLESIPWAPPPHSE